MNSIMMEAIKFYFSKKLKCHRAVSFLFDEISIKDGLYYNSHLDKIVDFVSDGSIQIMQ